MKNIVILGVARAGKTTLARMLKQKFSNYNIIDGDCVRNAFQKELPQLNINHIGGSGMEEDFPNFCAKLFEYQIKEHKDKFNYIFESCDITPLKAKQRFNIENTMVIFLGYPRLTAEEVFNNYKIYADENDYMIKKTDDEIMNRAILWLNKSREFEVECKKYGIRYIDVSYHRNKIFNDLIEVISNEQ